MVAVDGTTVRGARPAGGAAPYLVACLDHGAGVVLAQVAAGWLSLPSLPVLLAGIARFHPGAPIWSELISGAGRPALPRGAAIW